MKKIKDMLRRIGTAGLAAIMLTAQMPVTASAEEIEEPQAVVVSDEAIPAEVQTEDVLPIETDGDTATAETDGFSLYTVEFTYDNKQYVLPGDSEVALSEILDTVGLTGEVSAVEISDERLFSAKKCKVSADGKTPEKDGDENAIEDENGAWFVFAHQAFSTEEWMKVIIGGVGYEITVTDDEVSALQVDSEIAEGTAGHYYVNMPTTGTNTLAITAEDITAGKGTFKVYDDGGKSEVYSNSCNGYLEINVPENCTLSFAGTVKEEKSGNPCDYFIVYDGNSSANQLYSDQNIQGNSTFETSISTKTSTGNKITMFFHSDSITNKDGIDITVTVISPNTEYNVNIANGIAHGSIISDKAKAKADETITLTATPESGYLLNGISVTDGNGSAVPVNFTPWYKGEKGVTTATFTMPKSNATITATFTKIDNKSNEFSINLPKTGTETGTIPSGVVSFKIYDDGGVSGNYSKGCDGSITLTAPEGFGFQIEGKTITYYGYGSLTVSNSKGTILNGVHGSDTQKDAVYTVNPVASADQTLTIAFSADSEQGTTNSGVDLTVSVIDLTRDFPITVNAAEHGTVTPSKTTAKAGDVITLTPSPNSGYMIKSVAVTDSESKNVSVSGAWWTENFSFTMPYGDVTVTPVAEAANADGGLVIDGLTYVGKSGDNPGYYKIDSPNALGTLASYVNGGGINEGMLFKQTADINMSEQGYTPIGNSTNNPFNGTYDGDGYVILNLSYTSDTGVGLSGMFGRIANGTVKNVNLKDCNFTGLRAGGITGYMNGGTVDNCSVIGGTVSCGANGYSGGIVSYLDAGTVKDCFAANTVSAYSANSGQNGPIVGMAGGYTDNNYYTVAVSGGRTNVGTQISGGFITAGDGVTIGTGIFRTIGKTETNTYYFGKQGEVITFSAEVPTARMKKFATTAGTLAGTETAGTVTLTMPASDVTVNYAEFIPTISDIDAQTYTGSAIMPEVTVKDGDTPLTKGTDYTVSYSNNINAAAYGATNPPTVTITGKGIYLGTATKEFTIDKATINPVVSIEGWTYGDTANAPSVTGNPGNGAVKYQYRSNANGAGAFSDVVPTNAIHVGYTVQATIAETANYKGGTATATFYIEKKPVTVTGLSVSDKTYDGTTNATVTGINTAVVNGLVGDDNVTITSVVAAFADKNVGTDKTVTFTEISFLDGESIANRNYTLSAQPASVTASITPKEVTVNGITASDKAFNGTTAAKVDCSSASLSGVVEGETVTISGVTGSFADANVGDGKTVTLNYTDATLGGEDGGNYKLAATGNQAAATANITKAAAAAVPAINRTYLYTAGGSDSIDIAALLPANRGTATYTTSQSGAVTFSSDPAVTDGVLAYTVAHGDLNKTGTITVTAETQNYENITITVNINLAAQKPVELKSGTSVTLNKSTLTYGEALSTLNFKENTAVFVEQGNTENIIPGALNWKTPSAKPAVGTTSAAWVFTPTDTAYAPLEGTAPITVNKATPVIITVPTAAAITYGKTLADSNLENGAVKLGETVIEGTFSWSNSSTKPAVSDSNNTEYTVKFTPLDTTNYNGLTCNVKIAVNKAEIPSGNIIAPQLKADLKYTGSAQELITAGSVAGGIGTMQYALGTDTSTAPTTGWRAGIPTGTNVGTYYVWYKVVGDLNHNGCAPVNVTVSISKAVHENQTANGSAKYGANGTVDLSALIVDGGTVGTITKTDNDSVLNGEPTVTEGKLNFAFANTADNATKTATVTVPVTSANYADYRITVTLTVNAKDVPILTVDPITKTYDGATVTGAQIRGTAKVNGTEIKGTWKFEGDASFVNAANSGAKKVIFTPKDTATYDTAEAMLALTINKAVITIKAADKSISVGDTVPSLNNPVSGKDYTVTGLVGIDRLETAPTLSYSVAPDNTKAGSYTITPGGAAVPASGNYADAISYQTGTLTIKAKSGGGSTGGGNTGGGGSSGGGGSTGGGNSGGGSPAPVTPSENYTVPVSGENTVEVTAEITNGNAVINEISKSDIDRIIESGSGSKSGEESIPITIDLSQAKSEVYSVELSGKTIERLTEAVNAKNNVESVEIKLTNATVTLDGAALSAINEQAEGRAVTLVVEDTNANDLNKAQQSSLKQFDSAKPFRAVFESGGKEIHDFKGGSVRVSLSFSPEKDRNARHYHIYYLPKTGAMKRLLTYYTKGLLLFVTSHFSDYAIVYDQSIENGDPEDPVNPVDPEDPVNPEDPVELIEMHRLYNPNSGEHFFTGNVKEKDYLIELGWKYEGVAWCAPEKSEIPVYRLYNPNTGDHHYTTDVKERDHLIEVGWNDEGIGWYSEESETVALFRLYNPNALGAGTHHFTADAAERDHLIEIGWRDEKIGWYGALRMAAGAA